MASPTIAHCTVKSPMIKRPTMIQPPETVRINKSRVACDGASDIPGGAALGHPRVFLEIDEKGYVECGYCDRRFVLISGPADISEDKGAQAA
ncbi:putative Zn-finger protein [Rhizorhapis suberifaciens]|uniref:Putative Zn-finger protein n=2 Tax=Rhizorhapis suberifaciens TaxID=13656 RepID=A0A840HYH4_9SPHN|nr:putative Zn-finger protein [Rhizorhapis suberifaciens]